MVIFRMLYNIIIKQLTYAHERTEYTQNTIIHFVLRLSGSDKSLALHLKLHISPPIYMNTIHMFIALKSKVIYRYMELSTFA